jgi:hypothetical protein
VVDYAARGAVPVLDYGAKAAPRAPPRPSPPPTARALMRSPRVAPMSAAAGGSGGGKHSEKAGGRAPAGLGWGATARAARLAAQPATALPLLPLAAPWGRPLGAAPTQCRAASAAAAYGARAPKCTAGAPTPALGSPGGGAFPASPRSFSVAPVCAGVPGASPGDGGLEALRKYQQQRTALLAAAARR